MLEYIAHTIKTSYNMTHYIYHSSFYCMVWCVNYCSSNHSDYLLSNCIMCSNEYNCSNSTIL